MSAFTHDGNHFILQHIEGLKLSDRVPAGDHAFLDRIAAASDYVARLSPKERVSWFVSRLNFLTGGEVQKRFDDNHSDSGSLLIPLTVVDPDRRPIGIFYIGGYRDRLELQGGRDSKAANPAMLLIGALAGEPDWLEQCRLRIVEPDAGKASVWHCGWEGGDFIVG